MNKSNHITERFKFDKNELSVISYKITYNTDNQSRDLVYQKPVEDKHFNIIYVTNGELEISFKNDRKILKENSFAIFKPEENVTICTVPCKNASYYIFSFLSSLFNEEEYTLLRAFNNTNQFREKLYTTNNMSNPNLIKGLIDLNDSYLRKNLNIAHFLSTIKIFLSEICLEFDKKHPKDVKKYSDEYDLNIYNYICQNFNINITLESVASKFFVSKWYVNEACKHFYKLPFKQTITDMRMWYARGLFVKHKKIKMNEVARLCGYKEYSSFFKAYLSHFGISPKDDYEKYLKTKSFD